MRWHLIWLSVAAVALAITTFGEPLHTFGVARGEGTPPRTRQANPGPFAHDGSPVPTLLAPPGNTWQPPWTQWAPVEGDAVPVHGPARIVVRTLTPAAMAPAPPQAPGRLLAPRLGRAKGPNTPAATALGSGPGRSLGQRAPSDILTGFDGLDSTNNAFSLSPPDPQIAVGPSHVVEFVNIVGRITDKSGVPAVADFTLASFFGVPAGNFTSDPKIIYDDMSDRFFATFLSINPGGDGFLHMAVSQSDNPTGAWNLYVVGPFVGQIPDYPGIGVTDDKFTISYNLFDSSSSSYVGEQTLVMQKSDVVAGVAADTFFFAINPLRFTVRPAKHLSAGADQYLTTFDVLSNGGLLPFLELTVIRVTGTPEGSDVAEAAATDLAVLPQNFPPNSVTIGGSIDSGDFRMLDAVWRDESLWSSASTACLPPGDTSVRSCAHLIEMETSGTPSVVQDIMFGAVNQYYSWPAIMTDASANLHVSFTGTHASMFASAQVSGRLASDPLGTMIGSCLLKAGETVHTSGRWGDYLGAAVDPANPSTVWVVGEYAKNDGRARWGTQVGSLSFSKSGGSCPQKSPPPTPAPSKGNDNFANAVVISGSFPYSNAQETAGSTVEPSELSPCGALAATVWYAFTPSSDQVLVADTFSSAYDTVLAVYTGSSLGSLTLVGCNDDAVGLQSKVQFTATAGTTYHFQLGGFTGLTGTLVFNLCPNVDGDGLCDDVDPDIDGDGCTNVQEMGPDPGAGGQRDPYNPWDYFNPTLDGFNRSDDIVVEIQHYGHDNNGDPLYSTRYDRTPLTGGHPWQFGPPDGFLRTADITAAVLSYGHDCGPYN